MASHVLTLVGDMAGEARSQAGACTDIANNNNRGALHYGCRIMESDFIYTRSGDLGGQGQGGALFRSELRQEASRDGRQ